MNADDKYDSFHARGFGLDVSGRGKGLFVGTIIFLICILSFLGLRAFQHDRATAVTLAEIKTILVIISQKSPVCPGSLDPVK